MQLKHRLNQKEWWEDSSSYCTYILRVIMITRTGIELLLVDEVLFKGILAVHETPLYNNM